jgi:hypothetical protein
MRLKKNKPDLAACIEKGKHKVLDGLVELSWRSYLLHRQRGATHSECLRWGIGYPSFEVRYQKEIA